METSNENPGWRKAEHWGHDLIRARDTTILFTNEGDDRAKALALRDQVFALPEILLALQGVIRAAEPVTYLKGEPVYQPPVARAMALLQRLGYEPQARPTPLQLLRHHVTGAIERGEAEAIVEQPATPSTDGAWIPHDGGPPPVAPMVEVDAKTRDGAFYTGTCHEMAWWCTGGGNDIIAYRVLS